MRNLLRIMVLLGLAGVVVEGAVSAATSEARPKPVKIIFDTDMGNDVDDALALGLLHVLQSRGASELLAVTLTHPDPLAGAYIDAVNTFYGRGDIPIGVNPGSPRTSASRFLKIAEAKNEAGRPAFPYDFDAAKAPSALSVLRRTLAAAEDGSIVLVQVGFSTNLAALLDSPADEISPLSGKALIEKKVKLLSLMAGAFQTVSGNNRYTEYNVRLDVPSARRLVEAWPTPAVWSGVEIGLAITFPATAVDHDYAHTERHPLPESYQAYNPTPHERPTWDLTSVLYAIYPDRGYFGLSAPGRVTVEDDGFTSFRPSRDNKGRDRFMTVTPEQAARVRGLFEALCTEPVRAH